LLGDEQHRDSTRARIDGQHHADWPGVVLMAQVL